MLLKGMDELKGIEIKVARIEGDVKHAIKSVDGLSDKFEKLIDALAINNKESAERSEQIRTLFHTQDEIKTELKQVKSLMWKISIAIAVISSASTVGLENIIGLIK